MNSIIKTKFLSPTLNKNLRFNNSKLFLHLKWHLTIMLIIFYLIKQVFVGQNRNLGARMCACTHGAWMCACTHGAWMCACTHGARMRACTHTVWENTRRRPCGMSGQSLGVARLKATTWPVGVSRESKIRE